MSEIKTLKITLVCCHKGWCWRWCALQLILFPPHFETEEYIHEHGLLLFWESRRWGKDKKEDWIEAYKNFRKCLHHKCFKNPEQQQPVFLAQRGLLVLAFSSSFWTLDIRKGENQSFTILNQWLNVLTIKPGFILLMKSGRVLIPIFSLHHRW